MAGRGVAFGDLNNDGFVDAVISVLGGRPVVLRGRPNGNHWLTLNLGGRLGVKVRTGKQSAYATTSGSYLSASDARVHFGLADQTHATIEVLWPSGKHQTLENVVADRIITVKEPQ
jgi:hypothetical protein